MYSFSKKNHKSTLIENYTVDTRERVQSLFWPLSKIILDPFGALIFCCIGWLCTNSVVTSSLANAMCWWGCYLTLISIEFEKRWIGATPFPPLFAVTLAISIRWAIGGFILLLAPADKSNIITSHINESLIMHALFTTAFLIPSLIINYSQNKRANIYAKTLDLNKSKKRYLYIGLISGIVALGYIYVGLVSGVLDRGSSYYDWVGKIWRPDTLFVVVTRLRDIFFLVLPSLLLVLRNNPVLFVCLAFPTTIGLALVSITGGRGLLLWPIFLIIAGLWIAGIKSKVFKFIILACCIFGFIFTSVIGVARSEFSSIPSSSLERFEIIKQGFIDNWSQFDVYRLGFSVYGHIDPYLFTAENQSKPRVGTQNLENLRYLLIPRALMPARPEINDGHLISLGLVVGLSEEELRNKRFTSFSNITTEGDLYRRFGWGGTAVGGLILGSFYSIFCRCWYKYADLNGRTFFILLALLPSTFLQGVPLRSVSETAWCWLYEMPKYLIVFLLIDFVSEKLISRKNKLHLGNKDDL